MPQVIDAMHEDDRPIWAAVGAVRADKSDKLREILREDPEMMNKPIRRRDDDGYYYLPHLAITVDAVNCLRLLLQMLAERGLTPINDPNDKGISLVITAIIHNSPNCLLEVLRYDPHCLHSLDPYGDYPYAYAIKTGNLEIFRIILNQTNCCLFQNPTTGDTIAHAVVEEQRLVMFCLYLASGGPPLVVNYNGDTLAHALFKGDNTTSAVHILHFLDKLVLHGAGLNEKNNDGDRPYDLAVKRGFPHEVLEFFRVEVENTVTNH